MKNFLIREEEYKALNLMLRNRSNHLKSLQHQNILKDNLNLSKRLQTALEENSSQSEYFKQFSKKYDYDHIKNIAQKYSINPEINKVFTHSRLKNDHTQFYPSIDDRRVYLKSRKNSETQSTIQKGFLMKSLEKKGDFNQVEPFEKIDNKDNLFKQQNTFQINRILKDYKKYYNKVDNGRNQPERKRNLFKSQSQNQLY